RDAPDSGLPEPHRPLQPLLEDRDAGGSVCGMSGSALPGLDVHFAGPLSEREALCRALHVFDCRPVSGWWGFRLQVGISGGPGVSDRVRQAVPAHDHDPRIHRLISDGNSGLGRGLRVADPGFLFSTDGSRERGLDVAQCALFDSGDFYHCGHYYAHHGHSEYVHLCRADDRALPCEYRNRLPGSSETAEGQGGAKGKMKLLKIISLLCFLTVLACSKQKDAA